LHLSAFNPFPEGIFYFWEEGSFLTTKKEKEEEK